MTLFDADWSLIAERLMPPFLRKTIELKWLTALLKPLQQLRDKIFIDYANGGTDFAGNPIVGITERVKYNGQTIVLEGVLNKTFGVVAAPFIYIQNAISVEQEIYLSENADGNTVTYAGDEPNDVNTIYTGEAADYNPANDFTVFVPLALYNTLGSSDPIRTARVQSIVDKYKVFGMINNVLTY